MRALPTRVQDLIRSGEYAVHARVRIEDPDGQLVSIDDAEGGDWFVSARWDENIDQPVSAATIELARDAGDALSLSPWREDSPLNRNAAGEYAPRIDVGRRVAIEVATTASWEVPSAGSWVRVWEGVIDDVRAARDPIVLSCRDLGGELVDRQIETRHTYGSAEGVPVETVMQQILDDHAAGITLHVPSSPGQMITEYAPWEVSVMDALQRLAASIGWDLRYRWVEAESEFRLTFSEPDRAKTDPDYTFTPDLYLDIRTLDVAIADVRNVIEVVYADKESGTVKRVQVKDDESIERYGRRFARFTEGPDSTIDSEEEALAFAEAALQDLADPLATHSIEALFWWPAELGDLYEFASNGVHYNTPQRFAVVRIQHELRPDHHRTIIDARGRPAGRYLTWLVMATPASTTAGSASIQVDPTQEGSTGKLRLRITDPDLTIVAVQFQRRKGAELFDGDWSDVWDTAQGTPGTDVVLLREAEVELVKGHNSEIKWRALYRDGAGNLLESGGSHTFDSDTRADVTGAQVTFSAQGTIVVSATGDEDAVALYVTAAAGEEPPDPTAEAHDGHIEARTGTVDTGVPCAPGEEAHVKVRGVNAAGQLGPVWGPTQVLREDPGEPTADLLLITPRWIPGPGVQVLELQIDYGSDWRSLRVQFAYPSTPGGQPDTAVDYTVDLQPGPGSALHSVEDEQSVVRFWPPNDPAPQLTVTPYTGLGGTGTAGPSRTVRPEAPGETGSVGGRVGTTDDPGVYQADRILFAAPASLGFEIDPDAAGRPVVRLAGVASIDQGGLGLGTPPTPGSMLYGNADGDYAHLGPGVPGQVLRMGSNFPEWGSVGWQDVTDKPSTFPPSAHNHAAANVTSGVFVPARIGITTDGAIVKKQKDADALVQITGQSGEVLMWDDPAGWVAAPLPAPPDPLPEPTAADRFLQTTGAGDWVESDWGLPSGPPGDRAFLVHDGTLGGSASWAALAASDIATGTFAVDRIPALPASKIASGILSVDRIPGLPATKITSGALPVTRGGTGLQTIGAGGMLYAAGADTLVVLPPPPHGSNKVLSHDGATPEWVDMPGNVLPSNPTTNRFLHAAGGHWVESGWGLPAGEPPQPGFLYHDGEPHGSAGWRMPTAADVNALPIEGGTVTGSLGVKDVLLIGTTSGGGSGAGLRAGGVVAAQNGALTIATNGDVTPTNARTIAFQYRILNANTQYYDAITFSDAASLSEAELLLMRSGGRVGIGAVPSASYRLDVAGAVRSTGGFFDTSDVAQKRDIVPLVDVFDPVALLSELSPVSFRWRKSGLADIGLIAQETPAPLRGPDRLSIAYHRVTATLVAGWQSHERRIQAIERALRGEV